MASNNQAPRDIYPGFSDNFKRNFIFQRQFYQPDGSQEQLLQQQHEIQAPTTRAGREQEVEFNGGPDNDNTNEEEENSFVAYSLLMLQQAQNNSVSTRQINSKFPEDKLDIELFTGLVRQFPVIWNTSLNRFKDYNKRVAWIEAVVQRCSVKKLFLEISQNSQENTCSRAFFNKVTGLRPATLLKKRL